MYALLPLLSPENHWWRDDWASLRGPRGPSFWRNDRARDAFLANELRVDRGLEGALARGAEVLFSTDMGDVDTHLIASLRQTLFQGRISDPRRATNNRLLDSLLMADDAKRGHCPNIGDPILHNVYLAVPTNLEGKLLQLVGVQPFSTSVKTTVNREGGVVSGDDIRRRIDPLEAIPPRRVGLPSVEPVPGEGTIIRRGRIDPLEQAPQLIKRVSDKFVK